MSTSRISTGQMYTTAQQHVASARDKEQISGEKSATNKEINRPSQDPAGWMLANNLKDDQSIRETLTKNAQEQNPVLTATETIFDQAQQYVGRAYELAVANSGTSLGGPVARQAAFTEVQGIYDG